MASSTARGIILYGPPAAGKDTVTRELEAIDRRYQLFPRLKVGSGRKAGYRMITSAELARLREQGDLLWENERYGSTYAVDRDELHQRLRDHMPILHLGQVDAVDAVLRSFPNVTWLVAYLWCPRDVARQRILERQTGDAETRLQAWDETEPLRDAPLTINTARLLASDAARVIHCAFSETSDDGPRNS